MNINTYPQADRSAGPLSLRSCFIGGLGAALILLIVILMTLPVQYEANDDVIYTKVLSGSDGFPPDYSSTTHVFAQALSYFLYYLYGQFPSVPWYGLTVYLAAYLGISLIISFILRYLAGDLTALLLVLPAFLLYFGYSFAVITFTSASLLLESGVLVALLDMVFKSDESPKPSWKYIIFLAACFLLAFLLRWKLTLYYLLFGIPVLFFIKKDHLKGAAIAAAVLLLFVSADRLLFYLNDAPGHHEFNQYDKLRRQFNDTPWGEYYGETTDKALEKTGWNLEDYYFFRTWVLYDEKLFNPETLKTFLDANRENVLKTFRPIGSMSKILLQFGKNYILVFTFSFLALLFHGLDKYKGLSGKDRIRIVATIALFVAGILGLIHYRFVARVYVPVFAYMLTVFFIMIQSMDDVYRRSKIFLGLAVIFLFFSVGAGYIQARDEVRSLHFSLGKKKYIYDVLYSVKKIHSVPPLLVLMYPARGNLIPEATHPLREFSEYEILRIFPAGTQINTPRYFRILEEMKLKGGREFLEWIIGREDVLFVMYDNINEKSKALQKKMWVSYYNRNITPEKHVELTPVYDFRGRQGAGLIFYHMKQIE